MGASNSKIDEREQTYGFIEWYMESENYVQLSLLITTPNFNYLENIPMEFHKNGTCSYLHLAAKFDSITFVKMWLQNKYPINVTDYRGWTVLHWAIYYNSSYVFTKLLRIGLSIHDKIPYVYKKKNEKLRGQTALNMLTLMKRKSLMIIYNQFLAYNLGVNNTTNCVTEELYQSEYIPKATCLSRSYIFETLPNNYKNQKFQLIEKIENWSIYSNKYGDLLWKHNISGRISKTQPNCLINIVNLSYFQNSNTFSTEHIRN
jgi:hypothetical protein